MRSGGGRKEDEERSSPAPCCARHTGGRGQCAVELLTQCIAFCSQGVELQPPDTTFFHLSQKSVLHWHFLLDKAENLSETIFPYLCFNDPNNLWKHPIVKYLPTFSLPVNFVDPLEKRFTEQLLGSAGVSIKGLWFQTISHALWLFSGVAMAHYLIFLSISLLTCKVSITLVSSCDHHQD